MKGKNPSPSPLKEIGRSRFVNDPRDFEAPPPSPPGGSKNRREENLAMTVESDKKNRRRAGSFPENVRWLDSDETLLTSRHVGTIIDRSYEAPDTFPIR